MTLSNDLALVTACRDANDSRFVPRCREITFAALSLIEDTLNRHANAYIDHPGLPDVCAIELHDWPLYKCPDYDGALTALHTIATALGIETKGTET